MGAPVPGDSGPAPVPGDGSGTVNAALQVANSRYQQPAALSTTTPIQAGIQDDGIPLRGRQAAPGEWFIGGYYFDAWLNLGHNTSLNITQHPCETGAAISDHSYVNPRRFSFTVAVTDCAADNGGFVGQDTRSITAYTLLSEMQATRKPLLISCKYGQFPNCLIESIDVGDDFGSQTSMTAAVNLLQLIIADTQTYKVSQNPQATDSTQRGNVSVRFPDGTVDFRNYAFNKLGKDAKTLVSP